ncbi:interleukin-22 [Microcaecilia unicolor]|uniref:Interleukin-22 n=1 Tax=Microcaecilia unicolor TaxID=1415580 RepID=A0A6P7Z0E0_9AMPH|nr:interleukin-22 [Microcaecilia unicolor]
MGVLQQWMNCSVLSWVLVFYCLPFLLISPVPLKKDGATVGCNSSCILRKGYFDNHYMRKCINDLAKQASSSDKDTVNRLISSQLFLRVKAKDQCYLMKKVLNFTLEEVLLPESESQYHHIQDVTNFLIKMQNELKACKHTEQKPQIENNFEKLKNKTRELGESWRNKAIGELDLLFQHLESSCSQERLLQAKPAGSTRKE